MTPPGPHPRNAATLGLRKVAIGVAGFSVLTLGVALLAVPVPGTSVIVIPLGLTILAREFHWAKRLRVWSGAALRRTWANLRCLFGWPRVVPAAVPRP
ncbi:MAG TPA: PGPGW domain-containing protein [Polyangia bacterium]|nr:PGPGW domain-containing protein [Polyangia bacterium]